MFISKTHTPLSKSGKWDLVEIISAFYKKTGDDIRIINVQETPNVEFESSGFFVVFLVNHKHIFRYVVLFDRDYHSGIDIGVGPCFIGVGSYFDGDISDRFSIDSSVEAIQANLILIDEYIIGNS